MLWLKSEEFPVCVRVGGRYGYFLEGHIPQVIVVFTLSDSHFDVLRGRSAHHETMKYTTSAAIRPATCLTVEIVDLL